MPTPQATINVGKKYNAKDLEFIFTGFCYDGIDRRYLDDWDTVEHNGSPSRQR